MVDVTKAFAVDEALEFTGSVYVLVGSDDPSTALQSAGIGSLYLRTNGEMWRKVGSGDGDWIMGAPAHGYSGSVVTTVNYNAADKVVILVNTTNDGVTITLPLVASSTNKVYHIKWYAGTPRNKVTITAQTGETIDGETSQIMGELYDSLELYCTGTTWVII